ncbi:PREDICTED: uncharacterized protein LOC105315841, partial [Amphimedon queenslandica]|uniref:PiggyBac transposable element-derived protein domain-containing protein n=1 Tax=Amphimedon queenslandica TaxID=400682 RepID=A0AAN0IS90_AMPQE
MPKKPLKCGIKAWALTDSSIGYISNFKQYRGLHLLTQLYHHITIFLIKTKGLIEKGLRHRIVMHLVTDYQDKGYTLYMDNYYSSPDLFHDLVKSRVCACGTVRCV